MPVNRRLLLTVVLPGALGAQPAPLAVAGVRAAPGSSAHGYLAVAGGTRDTGARIPVAILHGARPGPVLCLVAGILGGKGGFAPLLGDIHRHLAPTRLAGSVVLVPIANPPSWAAPTPGRGPDGQHLNRVFPGRADGTVTERLAHALATEIVPKCDYLADLQSPDLGEQVDEPVAFAAQPGRDPRVDAAALRLARAWRTPRIVADTAGPRDVARATYLQTYAHLRGVPAITVLADPAVPGAADASEPVVAALRALGVLRETGDGADAAPDPPVTWIRSLARIASPADGVWVADDPLRDGIVRAGDALGEVRDPFGGTLARLTAPVDGVVLHWTRSPAVTRGATLALLGVPGDPPGPR